LGGNSLTAFSVPLLPNTRFVQRIAASTAPGDIHTLTQHIAVAEGWLIKAGAAILGQELSLGL
jgi:hypothetical protein